MHISATLENAPAIRTYFPVDFKSILQILAGVYKIMMG